MFLCPSAACFSGDLVTHNAEGEYETVQGVDWGGFLLWWWLLLGWLVGLFLEGFWKHPK